VLTSESNGLAGEGELVNLVDSGSVGWLDSEEGEARAVSLVEDFAAGGGLGLTREPSPRTFGPKKIAVHDRAMAARLEKLKCRQQKLMESGRERLRKWPNWTAAQVALAAQN
jgi:hypothetical protein